MSYCCKFSQLTQPPNTSMEALFYFSLGGFASQLLDVGLQRPFEPHHGIDYSRIRFGIAILIPVSGRRGALACGEEFLALAVDEVDLAVEGAGSDLGHLADASQGQLASHRLAMAWASVRSSSSWMPRLLFMGSSEPQRKQVKCG